MNNTKPKETFFAELVDNWTPEQRLKYLKDLDDQLFKDLIVDRLCWDFSDCETESDVMAIGSLEYLFNPLIKE